MKFRKVQTKTPSVSKELIDAILSLQPGEQVEISKLDSEYVTFREQIRHSITRRGKGPKINASWDPKTKTLTIKKQ